MDLSFFIYYFLFIVGVCVNFKIYRIKLNYKVVYLLNILVGI